MPASQMNLANSEKNTMSSKMDNKQCRALIQKYNAQRLLWDAKLKQYHSKQHREDAWKVISSEMNLPVGELKKKMTGLMGSYRREKSRQKQRIAAASGRGDIYMSKWFAFDCFNFLSDKDVPKETADTMTGKESKTGSELEPSCVIAARVEDKEARVGASRSNLSIKTLKSRGPAYKIPVAPRSRKRRGVDTAPDATLTEASNLLQKSANYPSDSYFTFGQHIANELRKYNPRTLAHVKHAIHNIIFEADMGKYDEPNNYEVTYSNPPVPTPPMPTPSIPTLPIPNQFIPTPSLSYESLTPKPDIDWTEDGQSLPDPNV